MLRGFARSYHRGAPRFSRSASAKIPKSVPLGNLRREAVAKSIAIVAGSRLASVLAQAAAGELELVDDEEDDTGRLWY